jgi:hypothetical protein
VVHTAPLLQVMAHEPVQVPPHTPLSTHCNDTTPVMVKLHCAAKSHTTEAVLTVPLQTAPRVHESEVPAPMLTTQVDEVQVRFEPARGRS